VVILIRMPSCAWVWMRLIVLGCVAAQGAASQIAPAAAARAEATSSDLQSLPSSPDSTISSQSQSLDPARLGLIESLIREQKYTEAIAALHVYLESNSDSWRAHYDLGYALSRVRGSQTPLEINLKESIRELSHSLQLNIRNAEAHKVLGLDLTMIQKDDLAEVEFQQAVHYAPKSPENHYFLGRAYMAKQNYAEAVQELKQAVQLDPQFMKAYDNLGIALDRLSEHQGALTSAQKAVELDQSSGEHSELPHLDLARLYREMGELDLALAEAIKAARINPESEESLIELGTIYRAQEQWTKALGPLQQAVALNRTTPQTYFLLGRTYAALGRAAESKEAFRNFDKYRQIAIANGSASTSSHP
jgi:tetratricopeptide (TPR) repeat protein